MSEPGRVPSHWWPRTRAGRWAVVGFLALMALAQPPAVWLIANRIQPMLIGMPFLYAYLLFVYLALAGVLIWSWKRGL